MARTCHKMGRQERTTIFISIVQGSGQLPSVNQYEQHPAQLDKQEHSWPNSLDGSVRRISIEVSRKSHGLSVLERTHTHTQRFSSKNLLLQLTCQKNPGVFCGTCSISFLSGPKNSQSRRQRGFFLIRFTSTNLMTIFSLKTSIV